jgi:hypothetical protein
MTCADLQTDVLVDLVDGRLDGAEQRRVERHLDACAQCRALVEDLRSIRAAAFMLDRHEPKASTWATLQAVIAAEPAPKRRVLDMSLGRRNRAPAPHDDSAAAAAAGADAEVTVESVTAEFEAAEKHYQKAIDDLQTIANKDTGELDPQVASVLQKNLTVIDQAITESRAALKSQPASSNAQNGLFDALRTKVALLQQTVELINEMRKGNQAEAGRRIQTLSQ